MPFLELSEYTEPHMNDFVMRPWHTKEEFESMVGDLSTDLIQSLGAEDAVIALRTIARKNTWGLVRIEGQTVRYWPTDDARVLHLIMTFAIDPASITANVRRWPVWRQMDESTHEVRNDECSAKVAGL